MQCIHCGKTIDNHAFFCIYCKKRVEPFHEDNLEVTNQPSSQDTYSENSSVPEDESVDIFSRSDAANTPQDVGMKPVDKPNTQIFPADSSQMQDPEEFFSSKSETDADLNNLSQPSYFNPQEELYGDNQQEYSNQQKPYSEVRQNNPIQQRLYENTQQHTPSNQQTSGRQEQQAAANSHKNSSQQGADQTQMWDNRKKSSENKSQPSFGKDKKQAKVNNYYEKKKIGKGLLAAIISLISVILIGSIVLFVLLYSKNDISQMLEDAKEYIKQGEYIEADKLYSQVLASYEGKEITGKDIQYKIQAHSGKSVLYAIGEEYGPALDSLKEARDTDVNLEHDQWKEVLDIAGVAKEDTHESLLTYRTHIEASDIALSIPIDYSKRNEAFQKSFLKYTLDYATGFMENEREREGLFECTRILHVDEENVESMVLYAVGSALINDMELANVNLEKAYGIDPDLTSTKLKTYTKNMDTENNENLQSLFTLLESLKKANSDNKNQGKTITSQDKQMMLDMLNSAGALGDFTVSKLSDEDKAFTGIMLLSDSEKISLPVEGYTGFAEKEIFESNIKDLFGKTIQDPSGIVKNGFYPEYIEYNGKHFYAWQGMGYESYIHSEIVSVEQSGNGQFTVKTIATYSADEEKTTVNCEAVFVENSSSRFGFNLISQKFS